MAPDDYSDSLLAPLKEKLDATVHVTDLQGL
jgi:hypothetical protein